ncbi:MAG: EF-P beta-lysylation protein EpmB [Gammaproteobacteria bacterium]|nr:EF-P beta-lysylation protein EpmB [Gammaproteobacteria bacterium]
MIHGTGSALQIPSWQDELKRSFKRPSELLDYLHIDPRWLESPPVHDSEFAMRVPRGFAKLMEPGNPQDPLLRQVLPVAAERVAVPGFVADPVGDLDRSPLPGLLHKYHGRALLIITGACAINCRYCFRQHFSYGGQPAGRRLLPSALRYLAHHPEITEVILSGGDPLMLFDTQLQGIVERLSTIPHLRRLRIHTRVPVVLPQRITSGLTRCLTLSRLQPILVLHLNHAREASEALGQALLPLRNRGVTLLNQSVLLKGVNDNAQTLCDLSESLHTLGVLPYYLHVLDRVVGAHHFETPEYRALDLHREMARRLPGYLVPKLVRELPGEQSKTGLGMTDGP